MQRSDGNPGISIIIPCKDGSKSIGRQLKALARQKCDWPWEIIVADNRSTDGTQRVVEKLASELGLNLRVIDAKEIAGANHARNMGADAATYDNLLFCDADDEVHQGWLDAMQRAFAGGSQLLAGDTLNSRADKPTKNSQVVSGLKTSRGLLPWALSANLGVTRGIFDRAGGFDEGYVGAAEDVEFSWRAQITTGEQFTRVPDAVVSYLARPSLKGSFAQHVRWETTTSKLFADFSTYGMPDPVSLETFKAFWERTKRLSKNPDIGLAIAAAMLIGDAVGTVEGRWRHRGELRDARDRADAMGLNFERVGTGFPEEPTTGSVLDI